jgi:hypothetical protein
LGSWPQQRHRDIKMLLLSQEQQERTWEVRLRAVGKCWTQPCPQGSSFAPAKLWQDLPLTRISDCRSGSSYLLPIAG